MNKIDIIYQKQREYAYVKSVNIYRDFFGEECSQYSMKVSLAKLPCWNEEEVFCITFEAIRNLKIGDLDNLFKASFEINLIAEYQYEDIKYHVKECENDLFSFFCKKIEFELC